MLLPARRSVTDCPKLHVWINQTIPSFQPEPPEIHDERIAQWRALKRFIEHWTKDSEDGSFVGRSPRIIPSRSFKISSR